MSLSPADLQTLAAEVGLDEVAVVPVGETPHWESFRAWLAQGYEAEMAYLRRPDAVAKRRDPRLILPQARSLLVATASYGRCALPPLPPLHGRVSRYAWGEDYHRWMLRRLKLLVRRLEDRLGAFPHRCYVDTGPVLERQWTQAAGLGWMGKSGLLLHPRRGSFSFLGVALLGVELPATPKPDLPSCGTCSRCLAACPTGALVAPGVVDARLCLAYLTIEHRGAIPVSLRPSLGTRVFGCDTCQEVCPWNRATVPCAETRNATLYLPDLLTMSEAEFRARFRHTAIWRATRDGLARNAAIVLGNLGDPAARLALANAARAHPSEMVREHAAWALAWLS